jgi:hypothetical protein
MKKKLFMIAVAIMLLLPIVGTAAELNNITTEGVDGNWVIYDGSKNIIATWDATNRKISIPSGSTLEVLGTASIADGALAAGDMALTTGSILLGTANKAAALDAKGDGKILIGNGTTAAMQSLTGDVTITNAGATAIGAGKVTNAMLASGAGVGALLTAGLGGSIAVTKTSAATTTIVAANATKDRAVIVLVVVDETYAIGTGTLPTVKIGEDDTIEKAMAATVLDTEAAGAVLAFAFTNTATKKIIATTTAAVGNATGGCSIIVLAIPTT